MLHVEMMSYDIGNYMDIVPHAQFILVYIISIAPGHLLCRSVYPTLTPCVGCCRCIYQVLH